MASRKQSYNKSQTQESVLKLVNVSKTYYLGEQAIGALKNIDFTVNQGEYVAIMGSSGAGKSTMLHIASLLDNPTEGEIFLQQTNVAGYDETELAHARNREIGFIFQQFNLLPKVSALENVALPLLYAGVKKEERLKRAKKMLQKVGLGDRLNNSRNQLSGGQQQRVAIARALINDPAIIFADEPTGNLDSQSGEEIMEMLTSLHEEGRTIVMVTHENDIADFAQRLVCMKDGRIISDKKQKPKKVKLSESEDY